MKESYGLDSNFEKLVLWRCSMDPRFWGRVGHVLDAERMSDPLAPVILHTCAVICKEIGRSPDSTLLVIQRLCRRVAEGKTTPSEVAQVTDLYDYVEDELHGRDVQAEAIINELAPVVRRHVQSDAVLAAHDEFARRGDFTRVRDMIDKAARIGETDRIGSTQLGAGAFERIAAMRHLVSLPTGILEMDIALDKGLARGQLGVAVAASGTGKSVFLAHQAAEAVRRQMFVGFCTLELPEHVQLARITANLTGVEVNMILEHEPSRQEAMERYAIMAPNIGICDVGEFAPHATSVHDIQSWVTEKEQDRGKKMDLLVVDYGDKLYEPTIKADNEYTAMRYVYEGLRRDIAIKRDMWVWTASQASRGSSDPKKIIDMDNVADSIHKIRVADLVITLNDRDDAILYFVAKNRTGKKRFPVGPLATDFPRGRITPLVREWSQLWG